MICDVTDRLDGSESRGSREQQRDSAKRNRRDAVLINGRMVFPIPLKTLELLKTIPAATKLKATIGRYSLPNAITRGSSEKPGMRWGASARLEM
jgi:hypothetical protein